MLGHAHGHNNLLSFLALRIREIPLLFMPAQGGGMEIIMNTYTPFKDKNINIHGRTSCTPPLVLFWTGSGIELNTDAAELHIKLESDFEFYEQWIRVELNGSSIIKMPLHKGINDICVFRGMETHTVKNVRLIKETQPVQNDPKTYLKVLSVKADGALLPVKDRKYKLEFIGDSITAGEGLGGKRGINDWVSSIFTTKGHYALQTAAALDADYRLIAQGGWGVHCSWDNNPNHAMPLVYPYTCSVLDNEISRVFGSCVKNDFSAWQPDAVIVNLGCNDSGAFSNPAWTDPETGKSHKLKLREDGSYDEDDIKKVCRSVYSFLKLIRSLNSHAFIIWAYGMIGQGLAQYIENTVNTYAYENNDKRASFCLLPDLKAEWTAAHDHPGAGSHTAAARELILKLEEALSR